MSFQQFLEYSLIHFMSSQCRILMAFLIRHQSANTLKSFEMVNEIITRLYLQSASRSKGTKTFLVGSWQTRTTPSLLPFASFSQSMNSCSVNLVLKVSRQSLHKLEVRHIICGQSYKHIMLIIYESRVIIWGISSQVQLQSHKLRSQRLYKIGHCTCEKGKRSVFSECG